MCGIAGVISWSPKYRVTRELLSAMSAKIAHRGPDGEGIFLTRENEEIDENRPQAALAFRRLAILDPDPRAMQPFTIGHQTIVFNGEIYNFRELREELTKLRPDYAWRTTGDTEVLLLSYATWGDQCLQKINGMFAFAVWDEQKSELFLARDRMGQKPLYFAALPKWRSASIGHLLAAREMQIEAIAFASEISALLPVPWVDRSISSSSLRDYLSFGYHADSMYVGIGQLGAHQCVAIAARSLLLQRSYFWPNVSTEWPAEQLNDTDAAVRVRASIVRATQRQLVSDVPLGCFLSGGIDSSIIAAAMRASVPADQPVMTFAAGFADQRYDERGYAEEVAKHLGTQHHQFTVEPHAAEDLPKIAATFSEPFGDSSALPTYYLAKHVRQFVKVCLSGDGGDELFGGYDRYRAMLWSQRLQSLATTKIAQGMQRLLTRTASHPKSRSARIRRFLSSIGLSDSERYQSYMYLDGRPASGLIEEISKAAGNPPNIYRFVYRFEEKETRDIVRAALATDRRIYLPYDLLAKADRCSMAHNLEVRSPFMDHDIVRLAAGLTTDQLLRGGGKRMLREAFAADLPDFVFKRKKMGFAVPIGDWLRKELRPMLHDNLFAADSFARAHFNLDVVRRLIDEHESHRVDHSQRLYALLMLELWHRGNR